MHTFNIEENWLIEAQRCGFCDKLWWNKIFHSIWWCSECVSGSASGHVNSYTTFKMKCMSFCSLCFIHFECNYRFYRKSIVVIFIIITKCFMECFCYFFPLLLLHLSLFILLSLFFQVIIILVATGMENCGCKINAILSN